MVSETTKSQPNLIPEKHPQGDLFICDVADAVLKDIMPQMEHPFYSLSKKPDTSERIYRHGDNWLKVTPSIHGLATIYDKDILIYCISQVIAKKKQGLPISKRVRINSADMLRFTNRGVSGRDYMALDSALERIRGTTITTNIRTGDEEQTDIFGLIDTASLKRKYGFEGRLLWCEVVLSDWIFNAIEGNEVLTLHRDYFRLRKPLERRLYEIARKHCGQQRQWKIGLSLLLKKTGTQGSEKEFRRKLKVIIASNHLPDYSVSLNAETDNITFTNRNTMPLAKIKPEANAWKGRISPDAHAQLASLQLDQDKYALEDEFRSWIALNDIQPKNADALFLDFCRKRVQRNLDLG